MPDPDPFGMLDPEPSAMPDPDLSYWATAAAYFRQIRQREDKSEPLPPSNKKKPVAAATEFAFAVMEREESVPQSPQEAISSLVDSASALRQPDVVSYSSVPPPQQADVSYSSVPPHQGLDIVSSLEESASALLLDMPDLSYLESESLTLQGPDASSLTESDLSSLESLKNESLEELTIDPSSTVPYNTIRSSPKSASSLGSSIFIRCPQNWYQTFFIRMDHDGYFRIYPDLDGQFKSLEEADDAIQHHLDALTKPEMREGRHKLSRVDWLIQEYLYYPDGKPRRGPNSPGRKDPFQGKRQLVQALLDQYNDYHNLLGDLKHELKDLVKFQYIIEDETTYLHFNFTVKTKKADDGELFFAEVSQMQQTKALVVNCCCKIGPNDNDICLGCTNNGCFTIKHPSDTLYVGGHEDVHLPFGGDPLF
ncbi:hypothetical protein QOZ80_6BG0460170 [Eleusine coracana subsp. coracana]|nr:hypothetical protein QOZ80_6BG0460170 [Eleusine coracana subsp. coracana]